MRSRAVSLHRPGDGSLAARQDDNQSATRYTGCRKQTSNVSANPRVQFRAGRAAWAPRPVRGRPQSRAHSGPTTSGPVLFSCCASWKSTLARGPMSRRRGRRSPDDPRLYKSIYDATDALTGGGGGDLTTPGSTILSANATSVPAGGATTGGVCRAHEASRPSAPTAASTAKSRDLRPRARTDRERRPESKKRPLGARVAGRV